MRLPPGLDRPRLVGSGGLGDVYVATRVSTGGEVAVKVLRQQGGPDAVLRRARRERDALSSLRGHPHVVHLEDVLQTEDGQVLLVMEFMSGGAIDDYARRAGGTLSLEQTVLVGEQAASALSSAHGLGVVHRDIKPQNLLINSFGHIKVCDFGISSLGASSEFAERTDALTYRYASPEEIRGDDHVGPLTDVYSLGVTLAALMTGKFVTHETRERLLDASSIPSVDGGSVDGVERSLRELIVDCLSSDLDDRPDSDQLTRRLSALGAELGPDRARHLQRIAGGNPAGPSGADPVTAPAPNGDGSPRTAAPIGSPGLPPGPPVGRPSAASGAGAAPRPVRSERTVAATALWVVVGVLAAAIAILLVLIVLDRSADALAVDAARVAHESGSPGGPPLGGRWFGGRWFSGR